MKCARRRRIGMVCYAHNGIVIGLKLLVPDNAALAKEPDLLYNFCVCLPFLSISHFLSRYHLSHFKLMGKKSFQQEMHANTKIK